MFSALGNSKRNKKYFTDYSIMKNKFSSTSSIWLEQELPKFEPLSSDIETDICIIGGGITGLTSAYLLSFHGKKIIIIDQQDIGMGETSRTTAHITNAIDDRYAEIEKLHGEKSSLLAAQSQTEAINTIEKIVNSENIDCDFKRVDGYLFFNPDQLDEFKEEFDAALRAGVKVEMEVKSPLDCFANYSVLKFYSQAQFHSLKYLNGLITRIQQNKCLLFGHTRATEIKDGEIVEVKTENGFTIRAKDVIVATNTPISDYVSIHLKQAAYRTYVVCYEINKGSIPEALYWDNEEPYHYIRTFTNGRKTYLIIGGEDHKTGQEENPEERFDCLEKWSNENFKDLGKLKYRWSGQVMEPADGLSFIGKDPENNQHVYIATGDSGMGITHGTFSALILTDLILGKDNPWAELYDPKRITLKAAPEYIKEGINTLSQYADLLTPGDVSDVIEIGRGEGSILRNGLDKVAVYKDSHGKIYKFSALCTHLKCVVQWNSVEKTWDCPCHGSRFSATGEVINGPAISNLEEYKKKL